MAIVARHLTVAPRIVTCADAEAVAVAVAERIDGFSHAAGPAPFTIALAGGATPKRLYETLAAAPLRTRVAWGHLECFFGDERPVPPDHPESNFGMVRAALLAHVALRTHPMPAAAGAATAYERLLGTRVAARRDGVPALDLVLLGIGEDGHTASLFPGTRALDERQRWVVMNEVPQLDTRRMTVTYPLINAARRVWILATGARKREIVARCLAAHDRTDLVTRWPVLGVRPTHGELVWWLDTAAAGVEGP